MRSAQRVDKGIESRSSWRCLITDMASERSSIEWTEATWNPTSGCTKVSPGCDRCYAERITQRFPKTFPNGFTLTLRPDALEIPLRWRRPRTIFVNSMSDLFHASVSDEYLQLVFDVMRRTTQHTYQILTKRAERLARVAPRLPWPHNVQMGVSVESPAYRWRIDFLRTVPAAVRFVSAEPLLAPLPNLDLAGIHWLIAGGESQVGCRRADLDWFRDLRDQCRRAGVAYFLKQLGGHPSKRGGDQAILDGRRWIERPASLKRFTSAELADSPQCEPQSSHPSDCPPRSKAGTTDIPPCFSGRRAVPKPLRKQSSSDY